MINLLRQSTPPGQGFQLEPSESCPVGMVMATGKDNLNCKNSFSILQSFGIGRAKQALNVISQDRS